VLDAILRTLGLQDAEGNSALSVLGSHLKEKRLLLILDNFEQVVQAGPNVAELLEYCPNLRWS
jgi:predicted ATPase